MIPRVDYFLQCIWHSPNCFVYFAVHVGYCSITIEIREVKCANCYAALVISGSLQGEFYHFFDNFSVFNDNNF